VALAVCGALLLVSLATGAWLWWPRGSGLARWWRVLTVGRHLQGAQCWRAWHNVSAAYLFLPLLLITLTGVWLAQPAWFAWLGLGEGLKPLVSHLHAQLLLGGVGEAVVFLAGLAGW